MRTGMKMTLAVAVLAVCGMMRSADAQETAGGPVLFANQYTQGMSNQATAQMYVAPVPVPQWVGHTYYTYQPLYPHEMMIPHKHRYHSYYDNGQGLNRTSVRYYAPPVRSFMQSMFGGISMPRP